MADLRCGPGDIRRTVARVVLLDADDAVLLFSGKDTGIATAPEFWFTPGGGADPGESLEEAARREVHEETGLLLGDLGPVRWRLDNNFVFEGAMWFQDESFFVVRTARFEVRPAGWTEIETRTVTGWRWWPLDELFDTDADIFPADLGVRLADLHEVRSES